MMMKICRGLLRYDSLRKMNTYGMAKQQQKKNKHHNHQTSKKPVVDRLLVQIKVEPIVEQQPIKIKPVNIYSDHHLQKIFFLNATIAVGIPFIPSLTISSCLFNSGFLLSYIGNQLKRYLTLINNEHYEQLVLMRKPQEYLKMVLDNMLFLSVVAICLAMQAFIPAHLATSAWYLYNVFKQIVPMGYWLSMSISILITILMTIFGPELKRMVIPQTIDMIEPRKQI